MTRHITQFNGKPATADDLEPLAFAGFAHFTALQVRGRGVKGLDLHLDRLRTASELLFGQHLCDSDLRRHLSTALQAAPPDVSVTCHLTSSPGEFLPATENLGIDVLVRVTEPVAAPTGPLALDVIRHERDLPQVKHVGEVAKTRYLRMARARGFDDAAFEDSHGRLSEATIWNLAFWDGASVVWPLADRLPGVTMQIVARQLDAMGVPQETREVRAGTLTDLSAVVMNSWSPGIPLARLGGEHLNLDPTFVTLLHQAYAAEPDTLL